MTTIPTTMKINMIFRMLALPICLILMILWPANDWTWVEGWLAIIAITLIALIAVIWLSITNPDLIIERMKGNFQTGQSRRDTIIIIVLSLVMLSIFPLAGFDHANQWMPLSIWFELIGWFFFTFSIYMLYLVFVTNIYLSRSIIVQEEGQEQVSTGIYGIIRHPMYGGVILFTLGIVLIMGSGIALIPTLLSFILIYIRALSEEDLLRVELEGYTEYCEEVRYRLIPGVL